MPYSVRIFKLYLLDFIIKLLFVNLCITVEQPIRPFFKFSDASENRIGPQGFELRDIRKFGFCPRRAERAYAGGPGVEHVLGDVADIPCAARLLPPFAQ